MSSPEYWLAILRSVKMRPGGEAKIVPSEARESLGGRWDVSEKRNRSGSDKVPPAPKEKKIWTLAISSQLPEEVGLVGFRDALAESYVSFLEGEQLRILTDGVGQGTNPATTVISPGGESGGSEDRRVECREDSVKYEGLGEHVEDGHLADGKTGGGSGQRMAKGESKKIENAGRRVIMSGGFIFYGTAGCWGGIVAKMEIYHSTQGVRASAKKRDAPGSQLRVS